MKKILFTLLLILLFPLFISAETNYKIVAEKTLEAYYMNFVDNGSSYMLASTSGIYHVDKKTGEVNVLSVDVESVEDVVWMNYNLEENKVTGEESTHYLIMVNEDSNRRGILTDNKLNIIKEVDASDFHGYFYFKYDHIIHCDTDYETDHYVLTATIFDKNLNKVKDISINVSGYYEFDESRNIFVIDDQKEKTIYTINSNLEFEEQYLTKEVIYEDNKLILYNYDTEINEKEIEVTNSEGTIEEFYKYNDIYYVHYTTSEDEDYIATYDNDLNLIKRNNISTYLGIENIDIELCIINNSLFALAELGVDNIIISSLIFYTLDENLNLVPTISTKVIGMSSYLKYETYNLFYSDIYSLSLLKNIDEEIEVANVKKINNKYYYLVAYLNNGVVEKSVYIYNTDGTLYKKINLGELTETSDVYGSLLYIDNKIVVGITGTMSTAGEIIVMDLDGNILNESFENIFTNKLYPYATYSNNNDSLLLLIDLSTNSKKASPISNEIISDSYQRPTTFKLMLIRNSYTPTINSQHGAVTPNTEYYYGNNITLNITPENGYKVKNIIIKDEEGNIIPVTNNTFEMPNSNITIDVEYEEITNPFTMDNIILIICLSIISLVAFIYNKKKEIFLK